MYVLIGSNIVHTCAAHEVQESCVCTCACALGSVSDSCGMLARHPSLETEKTLFQGLSDGGSSAGLLFLCH